MTRVGIPFVKMQGLGNDFVVIDEGDASSHVIDAEFARKICDRRLGVGADQLLWLRKPAVAGADTRMEIFNADGSVAEMCGNGIRAVGVYLRDSAASGGEPKTAYAVETLAGLKRVEVLSRSGEGWLVSADMGAPKLGFSDSQRSPSSAQGEPIQAGGREFLFFEVDMGNPHAVIFVDSVESVDLQKLGPVIETHPRFPGRTNVEFVEVQGRDVIRVRVWERGAGATLACGTGACASAVAALATGRVQNERVQVKLPGGSLWIRWKSGASVVMEGPAQEVFRGVFSA